MIELEYLGTTWWAVTRHYADDDGAKAAWERLDRVSVAHKLDLGLYRHGVPGDTAYVTALSHHRQGVTVAARVLGGERAELDREMLERLIARRVRVMHAAGEAAEARGAEPGAPIHHRVRRGTRGARLLPGGEVDERVGRG